MPYFRLLPFVLSEQYGEGEIRHVPSCYDKYQLPSLTPPSFYFLARFMSNKYVEHPQQVCQMNAIFCFKEIKMGKWMCKEVFIIQKSTEESNL